MPEIPSATHKISSASLHNYNAYLYLKQLPQEFLNIIQLNPISDYIDQYTYGSAYTKLLSYLEENINTYSDPSFDEFFIALYVNDNHILEHTFQHIRSITAGKTPSGGKIEGAISRWLEDDEQSATYPCKSPSEINSVASRFSDLAGDNFKPQLTTNIPTKRSYAYSLDTIPTEIRISTQGERHEGEVRVNPLFERFLLAEQRLNPDKLITHIYFNNLGRDRKATDWVGSKERALTLSLEQLDKPGSNIAVITFPADEGLMTRDLYKKTKATLEYSSTYDELLSIVTKQSTRKIQDLYISDRIREIIFSDGEETIRRLLDLSFQKFKIDPDTLLSKATKQAVWFDFIKFELTNHIINTLDPLYIHFSCKDAIDRGGVSSAYYNLMKSIEQGNPLTRDEFECALHAAPAMVKARGMNGHLNIIWNAIDAYINANYEDILKDEGLLWLINWRDANCPHSRVSQLLNLRIQQVRAIIKKEPCELQAQSKALELLDAIEKQQDEGVSGKRKLLEVVIKTPDVLFNGDEETMKQYSRLADELQINYPKLLVIGGLMKALLGILLYIPSFGYSKPLITSGWATTKSAFFVATRNTVLETMKSLEEEEEEPNETSDLLL